MPFFIHHKSKTMKPLTFLLFLTISIQLTAQQTKIVKTPLTKADYMEKSKNQKKGAMILLIGGGLMFTVGATISYSNSLQNLFNFTEKNQKSTKASDMIAIIGGGCMLGSIPLFVASSKNKKLAYAVSTSLKMETRSIIGQTTLHNKNYPALAIRLSL